MPFRAAARLKQAIRFEVQPFRAGMTRSSLAASS
jgi:hypothetical protein